MNYEELYELFDNEYTRRCLMNDDDPDSFFGVFETTKLLEMVVYLKSGQKIQIMYSDREEYIDLGHPDENSYVGLGSTLISPKKDIERIEVKWR